MFAFVCKPIQGGSSSLYLSDDYESLLRLWRTHYYKGYSSHAYLIPRAVRALSLFEDKLGMVPYKLSDRISLNNSQLTEFLSLLEIDNNLFKMVL